MPVPKIKEPVKLRQKELANGNSHLYLDIYVNGKRKYEFLKLYIINKPRNQEEKQTNAGVLKLANSIKAKRILDIQNGSFGLTSDYKKKASFVDYFKFLAESRKSSKGNYDNWLSSYIHFKKYLGDKDVSFAEVNEDLIEGFKKYLLTCKAFHDHKPLSQNSAYSYFNKFRAAIRSAFDEKIINDNPVKRTKGIKQLDTEREYLTLDELKNLVQAHCDLEIIKTAFLFSCLTGMRWGDIEKLKWSEVNISNDGVYSIQFKQEKTKGVEYLPVNSQVKKLMGLPGSSDEKVFNGLRYSDWNNLKLAQWVMRAGIKKKITFHCGRHTFATMQLTNGTDLYTTSKLLGHREIKTTQLYAKIIDSKKIDAVKNIPDINL